MQRLYGPEVAAAGGYTAVEERLRRQYPHGVAPVLLPGDVPGWLLLGYRVNLQVARDPLFSRNPKNLNPRPAPDSPLGPLVSSQEPLVNLTDNAGGDGDPREQHSRLRPPILASLGMNPSSDGARRRSFNRQQVRRHSIRCAHQLIDEFVQRGKADVVTQYAQPLPLRVISRMLGLSEAQIPLVADAVQDLTTGSETAARSNEQVMATLADLVRRKRESPGEDIASWLLEDLEEIEVQEHLRLLLTVTATTVPLLIASVLRMYFTDRRFRGNLAGGQLTLAAAVEQMLWDRPPFERLLFRTARSDTTLGEQDIKAGDLLVHGFAAANRDPEIRPNLSEPVHGNGAHLAFSAGPHACPGASLARGIAEAALETLLLVRLPDLKLAVEADELVEEESLMSRSIKRFPVAFTPGKLRFAQARSTSQRQPLPLPEPIATRW